MSDQAKTTVSELLERVKAAKGPDRELDLAIAKALVPDVIVMRQRDDNSGSDPYTYWEYTASVDACLALVERVLPGWQHVTWGGVAGQPCLAELRSGLPELVVFEGSGANLPLAILPAALTAKLSQEAGK